MARAVSDLGSRERIKNGPRPPAVRILVGYQIFVGMLLFVVFVMIGLGQMEVARDAPRLLIVLLPVLAIAELVVGILLLETWVGWWVALLLSVWAALAEVVIWLRTAVSSLDVLPWWLGSGDPGIVRTAVVAALVYLVLRPEVRGFYGVGGSGSERGPRESTAMSEDGRSGDAETDVVVLRDGTELPMVAERRRPGIIDLLIGYYALAALVWFFVVVFVARSAVGAGVVVSLVPALGFGLTALLLTVDRVGWWLALVHAIGVTIGGSVGYLVSLDRADAPVSDYLRQLGDTWLLQFVVGATMLVILFRPTVRAFYFPERDLPEGARSS